MTITADGIKSFFMSVLFWLIKRFSIQIYLFLRHRLAFPVRMRCCVLSPTTEAWAFKNDKPCVFSSQWLLTTYYPQFFTATILDWKPLLKEDKYKDTIVSSLKFLVDQKE
jgi:hypothetical protein